MLKFNTRDTEPIFRRFCSLRNADCERLYLCIKYGIRPIVSVILIAISLNETGWMKSQAIWPQRCRWTVEGLSNALTAIVITCHWFSNKLNMEVPRALKISSIIFLLRWSCAGSTSLDKNHLLKLNRCSSPLHAHTDSWFVHTLNQCCWVPTALHPIPNFSDLAHTLHCILLFIEIPSHTFEPQIPSTKAPTTKQYLFQSIEIYFHRVSWFLYNPGLRPQREKSVRHARYNATALL